MPDACSCSAEHQRLLYLEEVDSTNAEALRQAAVGAPLPLWVVAGRQTAGRGRSGRSWTSLTGNLHASLALLLGCPVARCAQLALVAGVALIDAIRSALPDLPRQGLRLKWPNDVLVGEAKVGGILVETSTLAGRAGLLGVIGIGLNLAARPDVTDRPTAYLGAYGPVPAPLDMHARIDTALATWLNRWDEGAGFPAVREAWIERAGPVGEPLAVRAAAELITGAYAGLDAEGALLITEPSGIRRRITYGDVTVLATSAQPATHD